MSFLQDVIQIIDSIYNLSHVGFLDCVYTSRPWEGLGLNTVTVIVWIRINAVNIVFGMHRMPIPSPSRL